MTVSGLITAAPLKGKATINPSATLTDATLRTPIAGQLISFWSRDRFLCSAHTGSDGTARCVTSPMNHLEAATNRSVTAIFNGTSDWAPYREDGLVCAGSVCR